MSALEYSQPEAAGLLSAQFQTFHTSVLSVGSWRISLKKSVRRCRALAGNHHARGEAVAILMSVSGIGTGISFASLRRFWAAAARWNSSRAPLVLVVAGGRASGYA